MRLRAALNRHIRAFFDARGHTEIDTPIAVVCPGTEVHLRYFPTAWEDHQGDEHRLYLRSSPELHMKQAVALGASRVFQIAPCFRNGGELSPWHHPEFTMLEWYETGTAFDDFVASTEALLAATYDAMQPELRAAGRGPRFKLPARLPRYSVAAAFREFAGLDLIDEDPGLARRARERGVQSVRPDDDFETAFFKILIEKIEPGLVRAGGAVLLDYPPSQAALAAVRGGVAKRFEIYLERVELCNGFEELLDPAANRARIAEAAAKRRKIGLPTPAEDADFYEALARGLPACCGNALGFDRWLALLMGDDSLDRAIPFRRARVYRDHLP
jgi:lysyl-tRNA synthetase class 2